MLFRSARTTPGTWRMAASTASAQAVQVIPSITTLDSTQPGLSAQGWLKADHCAGSSSKASASSTGSGARTKASRVAGGNNAATGTAVTREALCMVNRQRNRCRHAKN